MSNNESYDIDFNLSLINEETEGYLQEIIEVGVDNWISELASITDKVLLNKIPIISTAKAIYSIGSNIKERHLLKQTLTFFQAFHDGNLDSCKIESYRNKVLNKDNYLQDETDRILLILQMSLDKKKAELLGSLYREYVFEEITQPQFISLSNAIYTIFIDDLEILKKYSANTEPFKESAHEDIPALSRLQSLGLLNLTLQSIYGQGISSYYVNIDPLGIILSEL